MPQTVNSLWASWVQKAANDAVANGRREADSYKGAARAIGAHHIKLVHPSEALALKGVGPKTVAIIASRLRDYCEENNLEFPATRERTNHHSHFCFMALDDDSEDENPLASCSTNSAARNRLSDANPRSKSRTRKEYIPGSRTGGWGILIALYFAHDDAFPSNDLTKEEIIQTAQEFCDSSYTIPAARGGGAGNSGNFTAWSNMSKLKEEGLVLGLNGRPAKWTLTRQGLTLARAVARQAALPQLEINEETLPIGPQRAPLSPHTSSQSMAGSCQNRKSQVESFFDRINPQEWQAGTYDIRLLLDHRELKSTDDRSAFFDLCQAEALKLANRKEAAIVVEQRVLPVGDALWIAVHKVTGEEVVLDSIVERKRLDDLCTSIHDDRYHEQKARLKKSGLKDIIYLVENYNQKANQVKFGQMIQTAKAEVMVLNDCHLELTDDWRASVRYLIMRSRVIFEVHQNLDLWVIPDDKIDRASYLSTLSTLRKSHPSHYWVSSYPSFEKLNDKSANLNVRQIWARMAFCISGMSAEKVDSLVKRWESPRTFWDAYKEHRISSSTQVQEWSWIQDANESEFRRITPSLCKKIWDIFNSSEYDAQDGV
ncbi:uncharacterized protein MELLADRAFT_50702 [Melampsora larici-populina 98AG31]|uniref:Crossover junction endonuclease MUS81 n=1 Tax=Melampsora larici-populina (strain 98AG31 / pathotype 3-4-7) TaxID=747676 RepID=F4S7E3_MELLP|nr:uncharacterized protein MELLADRAFT_50702 [Melampsora larici-populina 98AG31]EGF99391.1 hypothetical protein MELLADRAFT_50702 [Melampsora larici-populina 98AG31]